MLFRSQDEPEWFHILGLAYRRENRIDDAIKMYDKAVALAPNEARYQLALGVAWRRKDDPDKAIPYYKRATELDPGNADAWFDLGFMYKRNKENDAAINAWQTYLTLNCKLKDEAARKRISEELAGIGGKATGCGPAPKKSKRK